MFQFERKIIEWIEKNIYLVTVIAITAIGVWIRYVLKDFMSADYETFLEPWYEMIAENGGLRGLDIQVGNYNMLYQFIIALMTYLPISALYGYKLFSCIFDFALAIVVGIITYELSNDDKKRNACLAYAIVLISPNVFLNSAAWAQCDAVYTFFCLAAILAFFKDKYHMTFILYGIAMAFKLQAVFFLPFLIFAYFVKKKFSALYFVWIPISMCVTNIPCLIVGRNIKEIYVLYRKQVKTYFAVHMNYPSFWSIMNSDTYTKYYLEFRWMAIGVTIALLGIIMVMLIIHKVKVNKKNLLYTAFLLTYTCVLFLPAMHERYGFCYEILAIIVVFMNKKTSPLLLLLLFMTYSTYGYYLFQTPIDIRTLGILNTITYAGYVYVLWKDMKCGEIAES